MSAPKAVVLLSGGLDSATAAAQAIADGYRTDCTVAPLWSTTRSRTDCRLNASRSIWGLRNICRDVNLSQWGGSALTDQAVDVPIAGYSVGDSRDLRARRNTIFLAIALLA
jgi:7-cyano-7-deazaguanine synthase